MSANALKSRTALLCFVAFWIAAAQTVLSMALKDLTRFYGAAAALMSNAVSGINKVEPVQIPPGDRVQVREELEGISHAISMLRSSQMPLVFDLSEYVDKVRAGTLDGKRRENTWRSIVSSVERVSGTVRATFDVVENSRWLKVTLDAQDRLALREVLLSRGSVLQKLRSLPPPGTTDEIDELDSMNKFYRQLVKSLGELNTALTRATERLALG